MKKPEENLSQTELVIHMMKQGYSLDEISHHMRFPSVAGCLNELMGKKNYSVEVTAGFAGINPATLHKIMSQKIKPGRNLLLRLAFALELSFEETQVLLKTCSCASLSGTRKRDIYIMEGIQNKKRYDEVNEELIQHGFLDLCSKG